MKKSKKTTFVILIILIAIIVSLLFGFLNLDRPLDSSDTAEVTIVIPEGAGTSNIANILEENNLIDSAFKFKILSKVKGYDGEFK